MTEVPVTDWANYEGDLPEQYPHRQPRPGSRLGRTSPITGPDFGAYRKEKRRRLKARSPTLTVAKVEPDDRIPTFNKITFENGIVTGYPKSKNAKVGDKFVVSSQNGRFAHIMDAEVNSVMVSGSVEGEPAIFNYSKGTTDAFGFTPGRIATGENTEELISQYPLPNVPHHRNLKGFKNYKNNVWRKHMSAEDSLPMTEDWTTNIGHDSRKAINPEYDFTKSYGYANGWDFEEGTCTCGMACNECNTKGLCGANGLMYSPSKKIVLCGSCRKNSNAAEEGNAPIQDPMEFGEMANWTPLDGSEGLKRKRAEDDDYEYLCDICDKPAKYNYQDSTLRWEIIDDDFADKPMWSEDSGQGFNDFYCGDCAKKEETSRFFNAESPSATIPVNEPTWVKPVATALGFALGFFGIHEIKKVL